MKLIDLCLTLCRQYSSCVTAATSTNSKFYQHLQYASFLVTFIIINTYGFKENRIDNTKNERIGLKQEFIKCDINAMAPNFSFLLSSDKDKNL